MHVSGFGKGTTCDVLRALFEEEVRAFPAHCHMWLYALRLVECVLSFDLAKYGNILCAPKVNVVAVMMAGAADIATQAEASIPALGARCAAVVELATLDDALVAQTKLQGTPVCGEPILVRPLKGFNEDGGAAPGVVIPPKRMRKIRRRMRQKLKKRRARAERAAEEQMKLEIASLH